MTEIDRPAFLKFVSETMVVWDKKPNPETLSIWYRALRPFTFSQIQDAFDKHIRYGKFAPRPGDITRRINGSDDKGEAVENRKRSDARCSYASNGQRCPSVRHVLHGDDGGLCRWHEAAKGDPAHSLRVLEDLLDHGVPFEPQTPHRERAMYLWECGGETRVLAEFDARYVTWLRQQEAEGHIRALSWEPQLHSTVTPQSAAAAAVKHHHQTGVNA